MVCLGHARIDGGNNCARFMAERSTQQHLIRCIEKGELARVEALLRAGAEVNFCATDSDEVTPLNVAIQANQLSGLRLLIQAGADVNCAGRVSGKTPLMLALEKPVVMRELILAGADVNVRTLPREHVSLSGGRRDWRGGDTALHLAAAANHVEAVKLLIQAGADVEALNESGAAPLDVALRVGSVTAAATALVEAGARLTPERLEAMHSGSHAPHSNLCFLSEVGELASAPPKVVHNSPVTTPPRQTMGEADALRCPPCGCLVHSRKARLCGNCGRNLDPDLSLSDSQARMIDDQRKWARDLADAFGSLSDAPGSAPRTTSSADSEAACGSFSPSEAIRRFSHAAAFNHRDRPNFALHLVGYGFLLAISVSILEGVGETPPILLLLMAGIFGIASYRAWHRSSPFCPQCRQNIRTCVAGHCHVCGKRLKDQRCVECGVYGSFWGGVSLAWAKMGNYRRITYCPACGVYLDSKTTRWRADHI